VTFEPRLEVLEDRCLLSGGVVDPTFGTAGIVTTSIGSADSALFAVATYPAVGTANDGKVVAVGDTINPKKGPAGDENFAVVRYNLDGTLDKSFGGTGEVTTDLGTTTDVATDVAVQPDGKIVVAGFAGYSGRNFALVRYNADGSLDTTFGGNGTGMVTTAHAKKSSSAGTSDGWSLALQADGKIDLAGVSGVVRYNANGTLDASFGTGGIATFPLTSPLYEGAEPVDLAIDPGTSPLDPNAGKLVIAAEYGNTQASFAVVRLNANGSVDTSFGGTGTGYVNLSTPWGKPSVAVQSDDRIVVAGLAFAAPHSGYEIGLARLNSNGTPDMTFGSDGVATDPRTTGDAASSVTIQSDGMILVAGTQGTNFMVAQYNQADGSLDTSFGNNGIATSTGASLGGGRVDIALEPDGRIVLAGSSITNTNTGVFALARFLATGPQIGSFTASPNVVVAGSNVALAASNVMALNPGSTVMQGAFYVDSNADGVLDAGDTLLGYGSLTSAGTWTYTFSTTGWAAGTYTLFAQGADSFAASGDPDALQFVEQ
jgi:uncharacterized delta-60 repeat protein